MQFLARSDLRDAVFLRAPAAISSQIVRDGQHMGRSSHS